MGKKKDKSLKKIRQTITPDNRILIAALGGVAAGITLAAILGADRARQIVHTVEDSVNQYSNRIKNGLTDKKSKVTEDTAVGLKKEIA